MYGGWLVLFCPLLFVGGELFVCLIAYCTRIGALAETIKKTVKPKKMENYLITLSKKINIKSCASASHLPFHTFGQNFNYNK
jgi:hypothetical protein